MSVAEAQRHCEDKTQVILDAYLRSTLASAAPIPGVSDKLDNLDVCVGVSATSLPVEQHNDRFPRVDVYVDAAESDDAALEQRDTDWTVTVAGVVQYDGARIRDTAKAAQRLASYAATVLERHLADPVTATDATVAIWDVVLSTPAREAAAILDDDRPHCIFATATLSVKTRTALVWEPTYATPTLAYTGRPRIQAAAPAVAFVDATELGDAPARRSTTVEVTSAQLSGATYAGLDISDVATWPSGSAWSVYMTRPAATVTGTTGSSNPRVPLATYDIADGDRWVVTCEHATERQLLVWAITWSVS